jgi:hypothetical protein
MFPTKHRLPMTRTSKPGYAFAVLGIVLMIVALALAASSSGAERQPGRPAPKVNHPSTF